MAARQSDVLDVTRGVSVTIRGASAHIRGSLGKRGSINMRLRNVRTTKNKLRKGCTGNPGKTRTGRLTGKLRLKLLDGKWVTIRSLNATTTSSSKVTCRGNTAPGGDGEGGNGDGPAGEPQLMLSTNQPGSSITFMATRSTLFLTRHLDSRKEGRATVSLSSTLRAKGSNLLSVQGGGAGATVRSARGFSGTGTFTSITGAGPMTTGPLTAACPPSCAACRRSGSRATTPS